ncbi:cell envelope integrity protein CreD [Superficieibacter electus]|uniref:Cell envelope integrity protein CreD n=1 Tax=Superficieibacter electus TaxID=2022662 RepID=A0A2P5GJ82_9ENTR|nr:cell envelope integrity protein CreD [Superficieibacter electus]POP41377.1 cell envelope integrity protein CreD [Superficieibacter electus]POP43725.1 cell envelope integrity protein CreD [Superficieibacter electus]
MLKSPIFIKILTLSGCMLLLLVPLMLLHSVIVERANYRDDVEATLRQSTSGPQKMVGPLIAIPVTEIYTVMRPRDDGTGEQVQEKRTTLHYWLPESLMVEGNQDVETRQIGIYDGNVWHGDFSLKAEFDPARLKDIVNSGTIAGEPFIVLSVGDARGIGRVEPARVNGEQFNAEPGPGMLIENNEQGIHIPLPATVMSEKSLSVELAVNLSGSGTLAMVPVGRNSEFSLIGNWPHPGFSGDYLPAKREITASGFQAHWQSSWFANNLDSRFLRSSDERWTSLPAFSVNIATPSDQYQLTDRATKYAILLIGLTFMAFFVFETLTALRLHPVQYLLVGLSLVMFYLILLALSEHIGFTLAWICASLASATLNAFYLHAVLRGWRNSVLFTGGLLALDGIMWQLLRSEENALLLGSGVLFIALSAIMLLTKNVDWHSVYGRRKKTVQPEMADDELRLWK